MTERDSNATPVSEETQRGPRAHFPKLTPKTEAMVRRFRQVWASRSEDIRRYLDRTSEDVKFHGGFGLAQLVSELASERVKRRGCSACVIRLGKLSGPVERKLATDFPRGFPASAEHYRIMDRIARGERP